MLRRLHRNASTPIVQSNALRRSDRKLRITHPSKLIPFQNYYTLMRQSEIPVKNTGNSVRGHSANASLLTTFDPSSFFMVNKEISSSASFRLLRYPNGITSLEVITNYKVEDSALVEEVLRLNHPGFTISSSICAVDFMFHMSKRKINISSCDSILLALKQSISQLTVHLKSETVSNLYFGLQCLICKPKFGMKSVDISSKNVQLLLQEIFTVISRCESMPFDGSSVARSCFGLNHLTGKTIPERGLIYELSRLLEGNEPVHLDSFSLGNSLFGIQTLDPSIPEVRLLFRALTKHIEICAPINLSEVTIGSLSFGLRNLVGKYKEEIGLIKALTKHVKYSIGVKLNTDAISFLVYGLRNLEVKSSEMLELIDSVNRMISDQPNISLRTHRFAQLVYGLQHMSSRNEAEANLIRTVAKFQHETDPIIHAISLSCLFYGMKEMTGQTPTEQQLIKSIIQHIKRADQVVINEQALCNIFYGIRALDFEVPVVREMLLLVSKLVDGTENMRLNELQIGVCCYGIGSFNANYAESRALIRSMLRHMKNTIPNTTTQYRRIPAQAVANICFSLRRFYGYKREEANMILCVAQFLDCYETQLTDRSLAGVIFPLNNIQPFLPEVRKLLGVLSRYISSSQLINISSGILGSICHGLENFTGKSDEEKQLIEALCFHLEGSLTNPHQVTGTDGLKASESSAVLFGDMNAATVCSIMSGMRNLKPYFPHVQKLSNLIFKVICDHGHTVTEGRELSSCCNGLMSISAAFEDQKRFISFVIDMFKRNPGVSLEGSSPFRAINGLKSFTGKYALERELISLIVSKIENSPLMQDSKSKSVERLLDGIGNLSVESPEEKKLVVIVSKYFDNYAGAFPPKLAIKASLIGSKMQRNASSRNERLIFIEAVCKLIERNDLEIFYSEYDATNNHIIKGLKECGHPIELKLVSLLEMRMPKQLYQRKEIPHEEELIE